MKIIKLEMMMLMITLVATRVEAKGILVMTFDDGGWDSWVNTMPTFEKYNAHVTFFPCGWDSIREPALKQLKKLQDAGHTIGGHTLTHRSAPVAFREEGPGQYRSSEVMSQLNGFAKAGIKARQMACPYNERTPETDAELAEFFVRFRTGIADNDPAKARFPVKDLPKHRVMCGVGLGEYYHTDIDKILAEMKIAAERDEVMVTYSHTIKPDAKGMNMKSEWLEKMLAAAKELGMAVKGFDELGPVEAQKPTEPLKVVLTFDDGLIDHLEIAAPELEKRGWKGVFSIVSKLADTCTNGSMRLNWKQVAELHKRGHIIANHGYSHVSMKQLFHDKGAAAVREEIVKGNEAIEKAIGEKPKLFCLPYTSATPEVTKIVREEGMETMLVPRRCYGGTTTNIAENIRTYRAHGRRVVDLMVHGISPEHRGWMPFTSRQAFIDFLDELKRAEERGEIKVVNYYEVIK